MLATFSLSQYSAKNNTHTYLPNTQHATLNTNYYLVGAMLKYLAAVFIGLTCCSLSYAGALSGTIKDEKGAPLPFANVYVQGTTIGTTANENGKYTIDLPTGEYEIAYQYISYQKKVIHVSMAAAAKTLDVVLLSEDVKLQEVTVKAGEDPAYAIMRKVIAARDKHYKEVASYNCQAYVKGLQRIVKAPNKVLGFSVNFDGSLDSNNAGIVYLSESVSDFTYKKPDQVKEVMISSKVSGKSNSFSWNRAADLVEFDFYKNQFTIPIISDQAFVTPLAYNAMGFYKFHLEGSFIEDNKVIYKIEVKPKGGSGPTFKGHIYVVDDKWSLHSVDLMLTKKDANINFVDTLVFNYSYVPVNDSLSVPLSQKFTFTFGVLAIKAAGHIVAVYRDYKVNQPLPKNTFTNEVMKVSDESNTRSKEYWDSIRPVPLTEQEAKDYVRKDTLEKKKESRSYLDSIDRKTNKPSFFTLLLGYNYRNQYHKLFIRFLPPWQAVNYNTVEGWNLHLSCDMRKDFSHKRELFIHPEIRYGFSNQNVNGYLSTRFLYYRKMHASVSLSGGQYVSQFNNAQPISEVVNSFYTLFIEQNYMKIFQEQFVRANHEIEPINGLFIGVGTDVAYRQYLANTSYQRVKNWKNHEFTPNDTINIFGDPSTTISQNHLSTAFDVSLAYQPWQKYISRPDLKIELESKWPQLMLYYKKAIPNISGSKTNYDYLSLNIQQSFNVGIAGASRYSVTGGGFVNRSLMGFMDYKHFVGNLTYFGAHYFTGFQLLDYYAASTNKWYIEAHYDHHFNGLFASRIPKVNKLKWQLVAGLHYFYTPDFKSYGELDIGIENIFKVIRVDFAQGYSDQYHYAWGFRFGISFNEL